MPNGREIGIYGISFKKTIPDVFGDLCVVNGDSGTVGRRKFN
jgi:hypothetical protein